MKTGTEFQPDMIRKAEGIEYSVMPETGLDTFRCKRRSATLSAKACAAMWDAAQDAEGPKAERLEVCQSCSVGACHAGRELMPISGFYNSMICPRCRRGATRIIQGTRCVSCYNREREIISGKNAKGTAPSKLGKLFPVELNVVVDGVSTRHRHPLAVDRLEPMIEILRRTKGEVSFDFAGPKIEFQCEGGA
ncbi:hypothetical protein [Parvibaculum sp. MBR-TMA-1.3b-4.2]|jgi:hypothetical protein